VDESPLNNCIVTASPWTTEIGGPGCELFQPDATPPVKVIVLVDAWTVGIGGRVVGMRRMATAISSTVEAMKPARLTVKANIQSSTVIVA